MRLKQNTQAMSAQLTPSSRIYFLDYARIFAFSSVLVGHLFSEDLLRLAENQNIHIFFRHLSQALFDICRFGGAGVVVFFMTSGYIIAHVLQKESTPDFLLRRFFRIYPLYIFASLSEVLLLASTQGQPFPEPSALLPRLLLIGDFTGTPYGLGGVEWTLRVEIVFYLFMAALKATGVLRLHRALPILFLLVTVALTALPAFPNSFAWTDGYFNIFFPFLLIGIYFYLHENKKLSAPFFYAGIALIFSMTLLKSQALQPKLNSSNFELIALATFYALWRFRSRLRGNLVVRTLSEMTYAVYLFHLWSWEWLGTAVAAYGLEIIPNRAQRLIILLFFCWTAAKTIERWGIHFGRQISRKIFTRKQYH